MENEVTKTTSHCVVEIEVKKKDLRILCVLDADTKAFAEKAPLNIFLFTNHGVTGPFGAFLTNDGVEMRVAFENSSKALWPLSLLNENLPMLQGLARNPPPLPEPLPPHVVPAGQAQPVGWLQWLLSLPLYLMPPPPEKE